MKFYTPLLAYFASCCIAANYILTPKESVGPTSFYLSDQFADELDLDFLARFQVSSPTDNVLFFLASDFVMERYSTVLTSLFHIEEDRQVHLNTNQFVMDDGGERTWHLRRVTQRENNPDGKFDLRGKGSCFKNNGSVMDMYVIDTGIDVTHPQFEGRASWLANFADDDDTDCNGHGTHVAGTIGSKDYGVCVDANLYAIKVLNCAGSGTLSSVIRGIAFAYETHNNRKNSTLRRKGVVNMSLGGGKSAAIDRAVQAVMTNSNDFYMVVAAGNENSDACDGSPSGSKHVMTVMASDSHDNRAYFSNWGKCADVYAPGVGIWSTVPGGGFKSLSGTSMASPLTAGVLLHYLDMFPELNMTGILEKMKEMSTEGVVKKNHLSTVNKLVFLERN